MKGWICALLLLGPSGGFAGTIAEPQVKAALVAAGQVQAGFTLPARPLPDCNGAVQAKPRQGKWNDAEITCSDPVWRRVIRLSGGTSSAPAREPEAPVVMREAVVTLHPIAKGSVIGPDDVALAPVPEQSAADSATDLALVIGRTARQSLSGGQPLLARQLQPEFAVKADQPVRLQLVSGRIVIQLSAIPLEDGELGQVIRVRHPVSGHILRARVTGQDFVTVETNTG